MQVTARFVLFHPNLEGENPGGGQGPPTSLPLPPTTREDLRLDGYLEYPPAAKGTIHLQTSMSSPGFEPSPYGTTVSIANHSTGWETCFLYLSCCLMQGVPKIMPKHCTVRL
ncbi:hypothetical protein TNCV_1142571 [Trichonephila clavipes]|nr:hypothetical protein TNCV_1142571 [Trichonephila clavipes]